MNRNRKLSEKTYGPRHVQPHMPLWCATKKKRHGREYRKENE